MCHKPELVVNSASLAFADLLKDSDTIIGVQARSQPYFRTSSLKGSLKKVNEMASFAF